MPETLLGLTADAWTAVGTVGLASATFILVAVGISQLVSIRHEAKKERTLAACERYNLDPVLNESLHRLHVARRNGELAKDSAAFQPDVATVLNCLDSIAVGIEQGLYIETLARDHIESTVKRHTDQFLNPNGSRIEGIDPNHYVSLTNLCTRWSVPRHHFVEAGWWSKKRRTR